MTSSITRWFRYVAFQDIPAYLALGWEWSQDDPPLHQPHGSYAVVMTHSGEDEPPEVATADVFAEVSP